MDNENTDDEDNIFIHASRWMDASLFVGSSTNFAQTEISQ